MLPNNFPKTYFRKAIVTNLKNFILEFERD
jgi:hypothetical protein